MFDKRRVMRRLCPEPGAFFMLTSHAKLFGSVVAVLVCLAALPGRAEATVFRDRAAFTAASQNLQTIDFESAPNQDFGLVIDGIPFNSIGSLGISTEQSGNKLLFAATLGEITRLIIHLPPGTTAVGCDQFATPMIVSTSTGESVTMNQSDNSTFVGFVSDQAIQTLTVTLDFPEPTPSALVDNLTYGQKRAGNEPPLPQLLVTTTSARALALGSVWKESEPFHVLSSQNFAADGHMRITLFLVGVLLEPADQSFVTVQAENAQQQVIDLPVESTARVKNLSWMSQVIVRLPDALVGAGNVNVKVTVRGKVSNAAPIQIN